MLADRYTKVTLTLICVALWLLVLIQLGVPSVTASPTATDVNIARVGGTPINTQPGTLNLDGIPVAGTVDCYIVNR